ncbi:RNA-binding protein with serine-rich domain 1-B-like [Symsagittifera roscoffensis]|uniref:RNA-binding protein with serine-rich domain 1-B-like n=1 Tax=Symsagittifera roscoffensis TaxID=84072 RepID=UPI00307BA266
MAVSPGRKTSDKKARRQSSSDSGSSSGSSRSSGSRSSSGSSSGSKSPEKKEVSKNARNGTSDTIAKKRKSDGSPDEKPRQKRKSVSPLQTKLHIGKLTKNINKEHINEIFGVYGKLKNVDMSRDSVHVHLHKGYCYVEFESGEDAAEAKKFMDGGQVDGQEITVQYVLTNAPRGNAARKHSPPKGGGRGPPRGGASPSRRQRSPSPRRRGGPPARRASPERKTNKRRGRSSSSSASD